MYKFIIAAVISAAALTGCASQGATEKTVTVTENPFPTQDSFTNEELYLIGIKSMDNQILNVATDTELLNMGNAVCEALASGLSTEDIISYMVIQMVGEGMDSEAEFQAVGYIIGAADTALCPTASLI